MLGQHKFRSLWRTVCQSGAVEGEFQTLSISCLLLSFLTQKLRYDCRLRRSYTPLVVKNCSSRNKNCKMPCFLCSPGLAQDMVCSPCHSHSSGITFGSIPNFSGLSSLDLSSSRLAAGRVEELRLSKYVDSASPAANIVCTDRVSPSKSEASWRKEALPRARLAGCEPIESRSPRPSRPLPKLGRCVEYALGGERDVRRFVLARESDSSR